MSAIVLLLLASTGHAKGVRWLALPAAKGSQGLDAVSRKVAEKLATSRGLELLEAAPSEPLGAALAEGVALAKQGQLEEASRSLQSAIAVALEAPHTLPPGAPLFDAMTQLASIALAGGDEQRADALFAQILELDPSFELAAFARSPRVDASLRRAAAQAGRSSALSLSAVGSACAEGASTLIVARGLRDGSLELTRFDNCRFTARVRGGGTSKASELAAALDPDFAYARPGTTPYYKKAWFWAGTGAAAVMGTTALYFLLREDARPGQVDINPIL